MEKIYQDFAKYYDLVYHLKDYKKESETLKRLIRKYKKSKGKELLEVACGTGNYLQYFKDDFQCLGTDINGKMLKIARKKLPKTRFKKSNMVSMNLKKKFDVILCLFSSIGYVKTKANLERAIKKFSQHLKNGGIVIIEAWFDKLKFKSGNVHLSTYESEKLKIVRATYSTLKGDISVLDMHWMVGQKNKGIRDFKEKHELGLFDDKTFEKLMKNNGLGVFFENGLMSTKRKLYVGVKKNS